MVKAPKDKVGASPLKSLNSIVKPTVAFKKCYKIQEPKDR